MNLLLPRRLPVSLPFRGNVIARRHVQKKAYIDVRLNEYIENLGGKDQIVSVTPGIMRNVLYPSGKASYIAHKEGQRNRQLEEQQRLQRQYAKAKKTADEESEILRRSEHAKKLHETLADIDTLVFKRAAVPGTENTFGSVTAEDLAAKLKEEYGLIIEKSSIEFKSEGGRIKTLGAHKITVSFAGSKVDLDVKVEAP